MIYLIINGIMVEVKYSIAIIVIGQCESESCSVMSDSW